MAKDKNRKNIPPLEITEVILIHCNIANNTHKKFKFTFIPSKSFRPLPEISSSKFILLNTFNSEFYCNEVWSTDLYFKPLQIKYKKS